MPGGYYGAFSPSPRQYGGGPRRVEFIFEALNDGRGNAYDTSDWNSTVTIENRVFARSIDACWATNDRAANQFNPGTVTDTLPRWERIYQIFPLSTDTPVERRIRLTFKCGQLTKAPVYAQLYTDLKNRMGDNNRALADQVLVSILNGTSATAQAIYPGFNGTSVSAITVTSGGSGYGSPPSVTIGPPPVGGATASATAVLSGSSVASVTINDPGSGYAAPPSVTFGSGTAAGYAIMSNPNPYDLSGTTTAGVSAVDWSSQIGHIFLLLQQTANVSNAQFAQAVAEMNMYLDGALPAWMTFTWGIGIGFVLGQTNFGLYALGS